MTLEGAKPLHSCHFPPLGATRHPCVESVWGTRGPEFKSRRPDEENPLGEGVFLSLGVGGAALRNGSEAAERPAFSPIQPFAYSSAVCDSNSNPMTGSSPTTQASWPGSMTYAWPGAISCWVPSSWTTCIVPDCKRPRWRT